MKLISLHVPKCAGTSLREALAGVYGEGRVYFDNGDRLLDPASAVNVDRAGFLWDFAGKRDAVLAGKEVVHGHFCMEKYAGVKGPRVTILRDPVDRLMSHYFYWKGLGAHGHSLHDQFLREQPTVVAFARMPSMRYFYTQVLFRGVDMGIFELVGSMEKLKETMAGMERIIGQSLPLEKRNQNNFGAYENERGKIVADGGQLGALRDLMKDEIAFYERHVTV